MTYPQHPQPRPSNPAHVFAWVALALAVLGVLLGVIAVTVGGCDKERSARDSDYSVFQSAVAAADREYSAGRITEASKRLRYETADRARRDSIRALERCEGDARQTKTTLRSGATFALLAAAACAVGSYLTSPAARERKRQHAWAAYYAAQQAPPHNPAGTTTAPVEDYETYESAPDEEPVAPAPEPEPEIPWYMKGDKN